MFFSAFASILISNKKVLGCIFIVSSFLSLASGVFLLNQTEGEINYIFGNFSQEIGIEYTANQFKLALLCVIGGIAFIFAIFLNGFVRHTQKEFSFNVLFCILQIQCASAFAIIFTNDLFNFYIFFELFAICCYILTALGKKGASVASFNYLFLGIIASGFLVMGIGFLYFSTGYLNFTKVSQLIESGLDTNLMIPFAFVIIGFLIKLGIFPFSFIQGPIYQYFPNVITPLYASIVSFITFYGLFVFLNSFFILKLESFKTIALVLSSIGVLVFAFFSLFENDIKKIFAYSSIAQISYTFFCLFFLNKALNSVAFLHLFSNSISKLGLFIIVFEVLKYTQGSSIKYFGGLTHYSKFLSISLVIFFLNIVGLPPLFGFFTKAFMVLKLIDEGVYLFVAVILVGALLNFLYFWRIAKAIFYDEKRDLTEDFKVSAETKFVIIVLFAIIIASDLFFSDIINFLELNI